MKSESVLFKYIFVKKRLCKITLFILIIFLYSDESTVVSPWHFYFMPLKKYKN